MINSIRYFEENSIKRFEELENNFMKHPTQMAEYILGIVEEGNRFLLRMIQETLESMNQMIIGSPLRKRHWDIECHSSKQLTTSIGDVTFTKTLFVNKETEKSEYLLDRILELGNPLLSFLPLIAAIFNPPCFPKENANSYASRGFSSYIKN